MTAMATSEGQSVSVSRRIVKAKTASHQITLSSNSSPPFTCQGVSCTSVRTSWDCGKEKRDTMFWINLSTVAMNIKWKCNYVPTFQKTEQTTVKATSSSRSVQPHRFQLRWIMWLKMPYNIIAASAEPAPVAAADTTPDAVTAVKTALDVGAASTLKPTINAPPAGANAAR